jgi:hypothetical protein
MNIQNVRRARCIRAVGQLHPAHVELPIAYTLKNGVEKRSTLCSAVLNHSIASEHCGLTLSVNFSLPNISVEVRSTTSDEFFVNSQC